MDTGRNTVFPDYVSAEDPESLRLAMFQNNVKHGVQFVYSDISFVEGQWFAWFHVEVDTQELLELIGADASLTLKAEVK